ncbi:MAG: hypothetical protein J2P23_04640 [Microlunatus sp.]|nr:hypothetical protein [Microlunatus sp.]
MIEEIVPPLTPANLVSSTAVETFTGDLERARSGTLVPEGAPVLLRLPDSVLEELRWVADQESCDINDLIAHAVEEFLADHWVRNCDF